MAIPSATLNTITHWEYCQYGIQYKINTEVMTLFLVPVVLYLAISLLCFGAAAALRQLDRIDLAPVAPNWDDLPKPLPYDGGTEKRIARRRRFVTPDMLDEEQIDSAIPYRRANRTGLNPPTERPQPPIARTTPGTEEPPPRKPYMPPLDREADRYTRLQGVDARIRRQQKNQSE